MSGEVRIKGLRELNSFLQQLPPKMEKNVLRGALRAGARVVAEEARLRAPEKTGLLRHGIKPAVLIVDTIFSSDGVFAAPKGFLAPAVAATVNRVGGRPAELAVKS